MNVLCFSFGYCISILFHRVKSIEMAKWLNPIYYSYYKYHFFLSPSLPVIKNSIIKNHWFGWDSKENKRVSLQYDKCIRFTTVKTVEGLPNQSIEWFVFIRIEYKAGNKMAVLGFVSGRYILWALLWKLIIWQKYGKKGTRRKITVEEREWIDRKSSTKN